MINCLEIKKQLEFLGFIFRWKSFEKNADLDDTPSCAVRHIPRCDSIASMCCEKPSLLWFMTRNILLIFTFSCLGTKRHPWPRLIRVHWHKTDIANIFLVWEIIHKLPAFFVHQHVMFAFPFLCDEINLHQNYISEFYTAGLRSVTNLAVQSLIHLTFERNGINLPFLHDFSLTEISNSPSLIYC